MPPGDIARQIPGMLQDRFFRGAQQYCVPPDTIFVLGSLNFRRFQLTKKNQEKINCNRNTTGIDTAKTYSSFTGPKIYFWQLQNFKRDYIKKFYWSSHIFHWSFYIFIYCGPRTGQFHGVWCSVGEKHQTFPMTRPKYLMGNFTNLYRIYKAHQTNVWWTMEVFRLHCWWHYCLPAIIHHANSH